jgi:hypothetical protein
MNHARADSESGIALRATAWILRTLVLAGIALLCVITDSFSPAFAFALTLGPSILCAAAFMSGALRFPRFLSSVYSIEPVLYRLAGVGVIKRIVSTRVWPVLVGVVPPPKPVDRTDFLNHVEHSTEGAEMSHWPPLVLASCIAILAVAIGQYALARWILVFDLIVNGYPIMLQRSTRWRVHRMRASADT